MKDSHVIIVYNLLFECTKEKYLHNLDEVDRQRRGEIKEFLE